MENNYTFDYTLPDTVLKPIYKIDIVQVFRFSFACF